ncbi:MAG TPA: hypothetical protein VM345_11110 [Acidimicrobiales bacterium]|nr:hypothetical protein [Acidimicrobiales bacterium]
MTRHASTRRPARGWMVLGVAMYAAVMLLGALPADAQTKPEVFLGLDQQAVINERFLPVPGYALSRRAEAAPTPENCKTGGTADVYCHLYKVNLDVPAGVKERGGYLMNASLEWDRGQEITNAPNFGSLGQRQLIMRIYEEPKYRDPETNAETFTAASGLNSQSPTVLGVVDPVKPFYWVLVAIYVSDSPIDYKLTLSLTDLVGEGPPVDLSAEEELPPVFVGAPSKPAPAPSVATTPVVVGPEPKVSITGTPAPPALPSLPGLGAPDFALDTIGGSALGEDDLQEIVLARGPRPLPPAGDPNAAWLAFWLIVAPLLALAFPLGFVWRRRREEAVA